MLKSILFTLVLTTIVSIVVTLIFPWPFDSAIAIFSSFFCGWYHAEIYKLITGKSIY